MILHLQSVPPRNGLLWVRHGLKVLQRKPIALIGLFAVFLLVSSLLQLVPLLGQLVVLAALPLVSLAFMLASHQVLQSHTPTAAIFAQPLQLTKERRRDQLLLGLLYAGSTIAVMFLAHWLDGGALVRAVGQIAAGAEKADPKAVEATMADPSLTTGIGLRLLLTGLISIPFWHAPALIHWGGQGVMQALFSSTLGVWRNKGAFALSGLVWVGLTFGTTMVLTIVGLLLGLANFLPYLLVPLAMILTTGFYCSLYFTFIDCFMFGAPRDLPETSGTPS
ncbi:BPSS1780 family membrane protein [Mitsuaria sp. GD03876]|uniref:BPSS1780 family membrane protein n=1 Tax=Mitsuaria sp. GD03876 TaxID=2975399 RepID=UPI0024482FAF|nr:BPSS1780 family membrane protein [Mitsuaria sp. GD03876]MDH0865265.1 BPSS1780 family membrane protein [Mitsuaria sp. GD03876]